MTPDDLHGAHAYLFGWLGAALGCERMARELDEMRQGDVPEAVIAVMDEKVARMREAEERTQRTKERARATIEAKRAGWDRQ